MEKGIDYSAEFPLEYLEANLHMPELFCDLDEMTREIIFRLVIEKVEALAGTPSAIAYWTIACVLKPSLREQPPPSLISPSPDSTDATKIFHGAIQSVVEA